MTTVTLHGNLGREIGETWELQLRQPREAIAAIEANTGKLYNYLRAHKETEYRVIVNGKDHGSIDELYLLGEFETIDIVPVPAGSGGGLWQVIIGVVLIIVGIVIIVATGGAATPGVVGFWQAAAPYIIGAGISLVLGGVSQMLAPSPKLGASQFARAFKPQSNQLSSDDKNGKGIGASYLFNGAINTTSQGNPVQVIYGLMIVGSQTISIAITGSTVDQAVIGSQRVAPADDDFFDLPVWARLAADSRGNAIGTLRRVQQLKVVEIPSVRAVFGIPGVFPVGDPAAGRTIQIGNASLQRRTIRGYLATCCHLFSNTPRGISYREAADLYQVLSLSSIANLARATWKQLVLALALHFSPEP